jgi:regulator of sigma E protease
VCASKNLDLDCRLDFLEKKIGQTIYSLNWLPIGGFVRLAGEDVEESSIEERKKKFKGKHLKEYFWARTKIERTIILCAGVTMNFLLAVLITSGLLIHGIEEPLPQVKVNELIPNAPAANAGVLPGDRIIAIQVPNKNKTIRVPIRIPEELRDTVQANPGKEIKLIIVRNGQEIQISLVPTVTSPENKAAIGINMDYDTVIKKYPWYQAPIKAVELNITRTKDMLVALGTLPVRAFQGQNISNELAGPVGIAQVVGLSALLGIVPFLNIISLLSLSLAVLNIMPVPALDGGRVLFIIIELITGKSVNQNIERKAHLIGMMLLLTFIALVSLNDLGRIFLR